MEKFEDNLTFEDIINQTLKKVKVGSTITGTIVEINGKGEIFVDIGYKADGIIPRNEYFSEKGLEPADEYKVGDKIKADVLKLNDGQGNVLMSCKHAKIKEIRKEFKEKVDNKEVFEEEVKQTNKNGLVVLYKNLIRVFIPISLSEVGRDEDVSSYKGKTIRFRVIENDERAKKIIGSVKDLVEEEKKAKEEEFWNNIEVGKKYTLTETIPADGYATAESITFVVENTADIQKVEMQDDTTKILISKVDMTDGSSEVKGAKLYILNENQEVMESWTSGDQPHYVEKLPIGTYTLLEETAPKGYIVANKVTFEVKDTGDVQGAKMEDEQAMGKVILNKTDKDTKKPMKGVEFALCDSKGKVLETLVTDSAGHAESKNYPIATFKNGQYKKAITYILKETKTLDGYQLDETEHKIQFEYVNDRTPVIEYTLDLTNEKAPEKDTPETSENQGASTPVSHGSDATSVSNSPKTGDNTNIAIFVLALAVSAGCLGTVVTVKRKRK